MRKHQGNLQKEDCICGLRLLRRIRVHRDREARQPAAELATGTGSWELTSLRSTGKQVEWTWSGLRFYALVAYDYFLQLGHTSSTFPNSTTKEGLSVQASEPVGDISHPKHYIVSLLFTTILKDEVNPQALLCPWQEIHITPPYPTSPTFPPSSPSWWAALLT